MQSPWPDVETLIELARKDPDALEAFRQQEIDKLIDSAPASIQRRLRGLQFQIDCKRQLHTSPMGACIELSQMMFDAVYKLNDALQGMNQTQHPTSARRNAAVLPFTKAV
jgi:hypothetical protein